MVSPELLRRYPCFGGLSDEDLRAIAMLAEERTLPAGTELFREGQPADAMYLLIEGALALHFVATDRVNPGLSKDLFVSDVNPGQPFGISALIEPYVYVSTVRASRPSRILRIEAAGLRGLCERDTRLAAVLMRELARVAMSRLHDTRVLLAAARA